MKVARAKGRLRGQQPKLSPRQEAHLVVGIRWFPIPADLPELDVRMHWHTRLDADPAQRWLRDTIRNALEKRASG